MASTMIFYITGGDKMGFFGGGGNSGNQDAQNQANALVDQQFKQNQSEIEEKKRNLYQQRLDIIKGQSGQIWKPDRTKGISAPNDSSSGGRTPWRNAQDILNRRQK